MICPFCHQDRKPNAFTQLTPAMARDLTRILEAVASDPTAQESVVKALRNRMPESNAHVTKAVLKVIGAGR